MPKIKNWSTVKNGEEWEHDDKNVTVTLGKGHSRMSRGAMWSVFVKTPDMLEEVYSGDISETKDDAQQFAMELMKDNPEGNVSEMI